MRRLPLAGAGVVSAILVLGGCGGTTLDVGKLEDEIASGIKKQAGQSTAVDCPDDVKVEKGARFDCTARADDGKRAKVRVVQQDDEGNVRWSIAGTL